MRLPGADGALLTDGHFHHVNRCGTTAWVTVTPVSGLGGLEFDMDDENPEHEYRPREASVTPKPSLQVKHCPALPQWLESQFGNNSCTRLVLLMEGLSSATPHLWKFLLSFLPQHEAHRIQRYRTEQDRTTILGSSLLQRAVISWTFGVPYQQITIERTATGKPFFVPPDGADAAAWNYNVSHESAGRLIVCAAETHRLVGIDVVDPSKSHRSVDRLLCSLRPCMTEWEWGHIMNGTSEEQKLYRFYTHWAHKEAYTKAIGKGLVLEPGRIELTPTWCREGAGATAVTVDKVRRHGWAFHATQLAGGYLAVVGTGPVQDADDDRYRLAALQAKGRGAAAKPITQEPVRFESVTLRDLIPLGFQETYDQLVASGAH